MLHYTVHDIMKMNQATVGYEVRSMASGHYETIGVYQTYQAAVKMMGQLTDGPNGRTSAYVRPVTQAQFDVLMGHR